MTLAKTGGRLVLRLANADVLPFELRPPSPTTVGRYVDEVDEARRRRCASETEERNRQLDDERLRGGRRPDADAGGAEARRTPVPVPQLRAAAERRRRAREERRAPTTRPTPRRRRRARRRRPRRRRGSTQVLMQSERALTRSEGLPRRPWFVHQIYAPGFYTGYGVKTLPAVREAIEQRHWQEAEQQIGLVAGTIEGFAKEIDKATALLATK